MPSAFEVNRAAEAASKNEIEQAEEKARVAYEKLRVASSTGWSRELTWPRTEADWDLLAELSRTINSACSLRTGLRYIKESA